MDVKQHLYDRFPERVKPVVRKRDYQLNNKRPTEQLHAEFVDDVFDSRSEYQQYCDEFTSGSVTTLFDEALDEYRDLTGSDSLSGVERGIARDFYAVTRAQAPTTVHEGTSADNGR